MSTAETETDTILDDPQALWDALVSNERETRVVDFPRKTRKGETVKVAMWVLTHAEQMAAIAGAEEATSSALKAGGAKRGDAGQGAADLYTNAVCREVLFRACRNAVRPERPFFPGKKFVSELTTDEVGVLYSAYLQTVAYLSPILTDPGSQEEMEARLQAMHRAGEYGALAFFSQGALLLLLRHLASRLFDSAQVDSSSGSPPSEPQPESVRPSA